VLQPFENTHGRHWERSWCMALKSKTSVNRSLQVGPGHAELLLRQQELSRSEGAARVLGCWMCEEFVTHEHQFLSSTVMHPTPESQTTR
jgi:hypothetical protein